MQFVSEGSDIQGTVNKKNKKKKGNKSVDALTEKLPTHEFRMEKGAIRSARRSQRVASALKGDNKGE